MGRSDDDDETLTAGRRGRKEKEGRRLQGRRRMETTPRRGDRSLRFVGWRGVVVGASVGVVVVGGRGVVGIAAWSTFRRRRLGGFSGVDLLDDGVGDGLEGGALVVEELFVAVGGVLLGVVEEGEGFGECGVEGLFVFGVDSVVAPVGGRGFELVGVLLEAVFGVDGGLALGVGFRELLGFSHEALDLVVREAALFGGDGDGLLFSGGLVNGRDC
mmetsp:Transcript_19909/g.61613  ORF Transcript_19909/g.61613 Transcript_19909/m.61613 type:complete len:215 (-) Transcript_19909:1448-2092(-)